MINFSLMGAGRIGKMHAKFIAAHPNAKLKYIYDVNSEFAKEVSPPNSGISSLLHAIGAIPNFTDIKFIKKLNHF